MKWIRPPRVDEILRRIEADDFTAASYLAGLLVRHEPEKPDAWFLFVLAKHLDEDHRGALHQAERARQRLAPPDLPPIAFLATRSALNAGHEETAEKWLRLVQDDPEFAERARADADMSRIYRDVAFQ